MLFSNYFQCYFHTKPCLPCFGVPEVVLKHGWLETPFKGDFFFQPWETSISWDEHWDTWIWPPEFRIVLWIHVYIYIYVYMYIYVLFFLWFSYDFPKFSQIYRGFPMDFWMDTAADSRGFRGSRGRRWIWASVPREWLWTTIPSPFGDASGSMSTV